MTKMRARLY